MSFDQLKDSFESIFKNSESQSEFLQKIKSWIDNNINSYVDFIRQYFPDFISNSVKSINNGEYLVLCAISEFIAPRHQHSVDIIIKIVECYIKDLIESSINTFSKLESLKLQKKFIESLYKIVCSWNKRNLFKNINLTRLSDDINNYRDQNESVNYVSKDKRETLLQSCCIISILIDDLNAPSDIKLTTFELIHRFIGRTDAMDLKLSDCAIYALACLFLSMKLWWDVHKGVSLRFLTSSYWKYVHHMDEFKVSAIESDDKGVEFLNKEICRQEARLLFIIGFQFSALNSLKFSTSYDTIMNHLSKSSFVVDEQSRSLVKTFLYSSLFCFSPYCFINDFKLIVMIAILFVRQKSDESTAAWLVCLKLDSTVVGKGLEDMKETESLYAEKAKPIIDLFKQKKALIKSQSAKYSENAVVSCVTTTISSTQAAKVSSSQTAYSTMSTTSKNSIVSAYSADRLSQKPFHSSDQSVSLKNITEYQSDFTTVELQEPNSVYDANGSNIQSSTVTIKNNSLLSMVSAPTTNAIIAETELKNSIHENQTPFNKSEVSYTSTETILDYNQETSQAFKSLDKMNSGNMVDSSDNLTTNYNIGDNDGQLGKRSATGLNNNKVISLASPRKQFKFIHNVIETIPGYNLIGGGNNVNVKSDCTNLFSSASKFNDSNIAILPNPVPNLDSHPEVTGLKITMSDSSSQVVNSMSKRFKSIESIVETIPGYKLVDNGTAGINSIKDRNITSMNKIINDVTELSNTVLSKFQNSEEEGLILEISDAKSQTVDSLNELSSISVEKSSIFNEVTVIGNNIDASNFTVADAVSQHDSPQLNNINENSVSSNHSTLLKSKQRPVIYFPKGYGQNYNDQISSDSNESIVRRNNWDIDRIKDYGEKPNHSENFRGRYDKSEVWDKTMNKRDFDVKLFGGNYSEKQRLHVKDNHRDQQENFGNIREIDSEYSLGKVPRDRLDLSNKSRDSSDRNYFDNRHEIFDSSRFKDISNKRGSSDINNIERESKRGNFKVFDRSSNYDVGDKYNFNDQKKSNLIRDSIKTRDTNTFVLEKPSDNRRDNFANIQRNRSEVYPNNFQDSRRRDDTVNRYHDKEFDVAHSKDKGSSRLFNSKVVDTFDISFNGNSITKGNNSTTRIASSQSNFSTKNTVITKDVDRFYNGINYENKPQSRNRDGKYEQKDEYNEAEKKLETSALDWKVQRKGNSWGSIDYQCQSQTNEHTPVSLSKIDLDNINSNIVISNDMAAKISDFNNTSVDNNNKINLSPSIENCLNNENSQVISSSDDLSRDSSSFNRSLSIKESSVFHKMPASSSLLASTTENSSSESVQSESNSKSSNFTGYFKKDILVSNVSGIDSDDFEEGEVVDIPVINEVLSDTMQTFEMNKPLENVHIYEDGELEDGEV